MNAIIALAYQLKTDKTSTDSQPEKDQTKVDSTIPEPLREIKTILDRHREEGLDETDAAIVLDNLTALKELTTNQQAAEIIKSALDEYHRIVGGGGTGDSLLVELLQEKTEALLSLNDWKTTSDSGKAKTVKPKATSATEKPKAAEEARKTMRVTEDSIDNFLTYVGELIAVGEMYDHLQKMVSVSESDTNLATEFRRVNETFSDGIMVAANAGNRPMAIYVDDVIGVQKVVLKELGGLEVNSQFYSAAAVMGDGTVAMVLDIDCLFGAIGAEKIEA